MENIPDHIANIFYFSTEERETIEYIASLCEIKFPEKQSTKYLQYVLEVKKRIVRDICDATEAAISHASKILSQRSVRDDNIQSKMATSDSGWTKKHSAKVKDLRQQHKKVTWEDKLKTVNRGEKVK